MANLIRFAECAALVLLCVGAVLRVGPHLPSHPQLALFLVSEIVGVVLILLQRRGQTATAVYPVAIAFLGTVVGLLVMPRGAQIASEAISTVLIFSGAAMALAAKLSLRRSFGIVPANRGVMRGGVYRLVRHPMYSGYMITHLGFLLTYFSAWNLGVYAIAWTAFWLRVREEEKFLANDPAYVEYARQVRSRLVPGLV